MALPAPGVSLSMTQIATEFGGTVPHSLSEYYRGGANVANTPINAGIPTSGAISIGNFYSSSKRSPLAVTLSSPTYNYNIYTAASPSPAYVAGLTDITVTVASTADVGSTSTATYAMSIPASFNAADTVTIINNGRITGMGGAGGVGNAAAGSAGGNAINALRPVVITNNTTVAGGGGGGGCGRAYTTGGGKAPIVPQPGGGSGGGAGFNAGAGGPAPGSTGTPGTLTTGGAGGPGSAPGGAGGNAGAVGVAGSPSPAGAGGAGGAAGYYIVGAPYATWPVVGSRLGSAS